MIAWDRARDTVQAFWLYCEGQQKWRKLEAGNMVSGFLIQEIGPTTVSSWGHILIFHCHLPWGQLSAIRNGSPGPTSSPIVQLGLGVGKPEDTVDAALHMIFGVDKINPNKGSCNFYMSSLQVRLQFFSKGMVDFRSTLATPVLFSSVPFWPYR